MKQLDPDEFINLSQNDCIQIQQELSNYVLEHNSIILDNIQTVAGVDIAYWKEKEIEWAVCCIVVIDINNKDILEEKHKVDKIEFSYIPGCFAFRELPLVIKTVSQLNHKPDIFIFDGNGILHPRKMGLATHASFYLKTPTIGVAKRYFYVEGAKYTMPDNIAGAYTNIIKEDKILGRAIRTHKNVKPIFISIGNYIDIDMATALAIKLTDKQSHIPIPTRYADIATHKKRKEILYAKTLN